MASCRESKSISVESFYGGKRVPGTSRFRERLERVRKRCETLNSCKQSRKRGKSAQSLDTLFLKWDEFPTQLQAFEHAKKCIQNVHVFSTECNEIGKEGKRKFIVTTYKEFWYKLNRVDPEKRNFYELIREGCACKLYFDLEFDREQNAEINGDDLVSILIKFVCELLQTVFSVKCDQSSVLDLDSTSTKKFSRHLIFNIPNVVFRDNAVVGQFVKHTVDRIHQTSKTRPELQALLVKDKEGLKCFVDSCVYSRNRNFRTYGSTKAGKCSFLTVSDSNMHVPIGQSFKTREERIFYASLVGNVQYSDRTRILTWEESKEPGNSSSSSGYKDSASKMKYNGIIPQNYSGPSLFPECDHFIKSLLSRGGVQGYIRRWVWFPEVKLLTYEIGKNRWCEFIGRAHKGNHVYFVVDFKTNCYAQKCHDPECRIKFNPMFRPLPNYVISLDNENENPYLGSISDSDMINSLEQYERSKDQASQQNWQYDDGGIDDEELIQSLEEVEKSVHVERINSESMIQHNTTTTTETS